MSARADDVLNFLGGLRKDLARGIAARLAMNHPLAGAFHQELGPQGLERIMCRFVIALRGRHSRHGSQRAAHGMVLEVICLGSVALRTGRVADIVHIRADIAVRSGKR